ncbi:Flp pilus assembly protein CpaB [Thauera linaloolentis]|uniref:Flp pilus assembly protein CpaB n=1 Tax=Thauera linaloolentis (strain DSM 12138 / JCM 21573 / CCUG 41526 / CIP 105981 / IAM 15112 / NBRC 102519 / 47Lol) TaxID=1123367 RepID=N6Z615_THAL4|nr:Flp pilus assembly protein CpaB [Thauera linaloolentis]ENO87639.1 Flp pilus assembly protein CpaB [Thauera linaloolentis 47Lol = DSM 12138]MCM8565967.1 Flp pilus assembly protein CpaB [Thauera linaloolentis]
MKKKSLVLLASAITLAAGVALLARALMRPPPPVTVVKEVEVPSTPPREVLAAGHALVPGDFLDGSALIWRKLPGEAIQAIHFAAAADADRRQLERGLYGATLRRPLAEGEPFTRDLLVHAGEPGFLAAVLKPGLRAVSIPTSAVSSNAGLVSAGDWVDVILSLNRDGIDPQQAVAGSTPYAELASQTILRRVRVLALNSNTASIAPAATAADDEAGRSTGARGTRASGGTSQRTSYESITLEVTPEAAEQLAVAREIGTLQVALRSVRQEEDDGGDAFPAARSVTRLGDVTTIFERPRQGGSAPVTVQTYHGAQQGAQTFGAH